MDLFPDCSQNALARLVSDHCPLLLEIDWGPPPFRFEIAWLRGKGFNDCVKDWWASFSVSGWNGY